MSELFNPEPVDDSSTGRLQSYAMGTPTTPPATKTLRVSLETHKRVMDLAENLGGSADDALDHLIGASTIRIQVSDIQRKRWSEAAHRAGVGVAEFVKMRVEAALQYGADPGGLQQIYEQVCAVARYVGMKRTAPSTVDGPHVMGRRHDVDQSTPREPDLFEGES